MTLEKYMDKSLEFAELVAKIEACQDCELCRTGQHKCIPLGNLNAKTFFVGEAPGAVAEPELRGLTFVGNRSSDLMLEAIYKIWPKGYDDIYITNVVKCNPPENRKPTDQEIATCSKWLLAEFRLVGPKTIVALGRTAANFFGVKEGISSARLKEYTWNRKKVIVLFHPAYILRLGPRAEESFISQIKIIRRQENES